MVTSRKRKTRKLKVKLKRLGRTKPKLTVDSLIEQQKGYFPFQFMNDTKHDIIVRQTSWSCPLNPGTVKPLELKVLWLKPGGFVKLWDYTKLLGHFHLMVE